MLRICAKLDAEVATWASRPLDHIAFPYLFCDATYCKVRVNGRVVSQAVVIATGVSADGRGEVLGCPVGDSETEAFWTGFLRGLRERHLDGVQLVISDSHRGLTNAIAAVLQGASWQRSHPSTSRRELLSRVFCHDKLPVIMAHDPHERRRSPPSQFFEGG